MIKDDLLNKLESGFYPENTIIPTELELADIYQVSRPTVRQAISVLVADGYLERKKRKGTMVKRKKIDQAFTQVIQSFESEMLQKGLIPKTTVLSLKKDSANFEVAESLALVEGAPIFKLMRLRYALEEPVVLVTTYVPAHLFKGFLTVDFEKNSLYQIMSDMGYPVSSIKRKLDVLKADETTSDLLSIEENDPIFYFHSTGFTKEKIPVEYSISKYRGDLNSFEFEITTE
nr:GntR family transcriptional regulator [Carnobacterium gallinarum]